MPRSASAYRSRRCRSRYADSSRRLACRSSRARAATSRLPRRGGCSTARRRALIAHAERVGERDDRGAHGRGGQVFLGCVPSGLFGVLPRILEGRDDAFEIRVTEAHTADIVAAVVDGRLDAGSYGRTARRAASRCGPLERVRFTVAVPARHALAAKRRVGLARARARGAHRAAPRRDAAPVRPHPRGLSRRRA